MEHDEHLDEWDDAGHDEAPEPDPEPSLKVLIYSDDRVVRRQIMAALGKRPAADLPVLEYTECATEPMAMRYADKGRYDLLILDGEATPAGGMGVCRQIKDELYNCPPILVLVGRPQDAWLATWCRADGVSAHPIDAITLAGVASTLLRRRTSVAVAS